MTAKRFCLFILLSATLQSWTWRRGPYLPFPRDSESCEVEGLRVDVPFERFPIRLGDARYLCLRHGGAFPQVRVTNSSTTPIVGLLFVLEYKSGSDETLGQISFAGAVDPAAQRNSWPIHPEYLDFQLSKPFLPGRTVQMNGASMMQFHSCPSRAKLVFGTLTFAKGRQETWSYPGWAFGPVVDEFPGRLSRQIVPFTNLPAAISARVKLDERGEVIQITPTSTGARDPSSVRTVWNLLEGWSFFPAVRDGKPTESTLSIAFQFLPDPQLQIPVDHSGLEQSWILVRAIHDQSDPDSWLLSSGLRVGKWTLE